MNIRITADSTCDLPEELVAKNNITIIPLYIIKGEDSLKDGLEITPTEMFEYADRTNELCRTSAPSVVDYATVFGRLRSECDCIIHLSLSSALSACCQDARIAAEEVGGVYVIDTRNLSTGSGHLVLKAAEFAQQGLSAEEIVEK
ncbi:MAG: DegV family EDD domain-containing protein, partial [Oscillospiraceae bacterium]|nr:DegV family EDD domain-containing protein [Oscillospiraceae bacterium]